MTYASFFPSQVIVATFTYITEEYDYCNEPDDPVEKRYVVVFKANEFTFRTLINSYSLKCLIIFKFYFLIAILHCQQTAPF